MNCNRIISVWLYYNAIAVNNLPSRYFHHTLGFNSYIGVPLLINGRKFGTLSFYSKKKKEPFSNIELSVVQMIGHYISNKLSREENSQKIKESTKNLQVSNQKLEDFAHIISHDLKEALRSINYYTEMLLEDEGDRLKKESVNKVEKISEYTKRMYNIMTSLLFYSHHTHVQLAIKQVDLNVILNQVIESLRILINDSHTTIVIPHLLPVILCDESRVGEIFYNLVTNAIKYNDNKKKIVEIGFMKEMDEVSSQKVSYVKDNGIGINAKNHDKIFEIFTRLSIKKDYVEGTGSGLTIIKKIIENHQGRIWLKSEEGKGSTFFFTLEKAKQLSNP